MLLDILTVIWYILFFYGNNNGIIFLQSEQAIYNCKNAKRQFYDSNLHIFIIYTLKFYVIVIR